MGKLIYKPEKLYSEDINDLVEADLEKGGPGSGVKGHKTPKKPHASITLQPLTPEQQAERVARNKAMLDQNAKAREARRNAQKS